MNKYKVNGIQRIWREDSYAYSNPRCLKHLDIAAKEVKCRKNCRCSQCHSTIYAGEIALKTIQAVNTGDGYYRNNFCQDCYSILSEEELIALDIR